MVRKSATGADGRLPLGAQDAADRPPNGCHEAPLVLGDPRHAPPVAARRDGTNGELGRLAVGQRVYRGTVGLGRRPHQEGRPARGGNARNARAYARHRPAVQAHPSRALERDELSPGREAEVVTREPADSVRVDVEGGAPVKERALVVQVPGLRIEADGASERASGWRLSSGDRRQDTGGHEDPRNPRNERSIRRDHWWHRSATGTGPRAAAVEPASWRSEHRGPRPRIDLPQASRDLEAEVQVGGPDDDRGPIRVQLELVQAALHRREHRGRQSADVSKMPRTVTPVLGRLLV